MQAIYSNTTFVTCGGKNILFCSRYLQGLFWPLLATPAAPNK